MNSPKPLFPGLPQWAQTRSAAFLLFLFIVALLVVFGDLFPTTYTRADALEDTTELVKKVLPPTLDKGDYDRRMLALANNPAPATTTGTSTPAKPTLWPVTDAPYPKVGAILPFNRIIAYYGNFYSTAMGALGQYEPQEMLTRLKAEAANWEAADPTTPVVPALHYIVETAQESPGKDGKYRLRMPDSQIDKALELAAQIDAIVFLDFQVSLSDLQTELPMYEEYLKKPNVHLGIDPEFSMKSGDTPGSVIGTFDAADINYAANYLARLVQENDLPPKVLVVHRFTQLMVTNSQNITPLPEVQIVMHMDGWGDPAKKFGTYKRVVAPEPVQFTGFKIFYRNDLKPPSTRLVTPAELLELTPRPIYIQYQ